MRSRTNSSIGETRVREKIPFRRPVQVNLSGRSIDEQYEQRGLSINPVSVTLQVAMNDELFEHLGDCYRSQVDVHLSTDDGLLNDKRIILRHTRRFRTVLTKWIFSFTGSLGSLRLDQLATRTLPT